MRKLCALIPLLLAGLSLDAVSAELREPPTFYSSDHQLDLLVIAKAKTIQLDEFSPAAWIYEVCYRRDAVGDG